MAPCVCRSLLQLLILLSAAAILQPTAGQPVLPTALSSGPPASALPPQPAAAPRLAPGPIGIQQVQQAQQAGTKIAPILQPHDFDGYPDMRMPLANSTYRVVGAGLLPLTPQIKAGLLQAFQVIYSAPRLEIINSWIIPTELATNITQANVSDTYESALAANTTHAISLNGNFGDSNAVPALEAYQSVDITVYAAWHPNSSWPTQGGIEATYNQFTHQLLAQNNITANNFCVHKDITREAAPVIARLGIPQLASYTVALQLVGPQVPPMDVRKQTLVANALNSLLLGAAAAGCLRVTGVSEVVLQPPAGSSVDGASLPPIGIANITMVISQKDLAAASPLPQALNSLFDNYVFVTTLRSFGLNVSASVLSVMPLPGDSISDQIDSYTGRSNASAAPTAAIPAAAKGAAPVGAIAGGVVAAVVLALIAAVGLFVWQRRRKQAASVSQLGYEKRRSVFAFRGPKDPECRDGVDDLKPPLPLAPGPAGHAEARGETPSLTEFQQAAIRIGVPGMSAVKYAQLDGSSSTNSGSGAYTQPGCSVSTFAPQSSSRTLTDHIAGDFVHGWDVSHDDIELCRRPDGSEWVLGEGSFGMVFRALRSGVQDVAVKTLTRADSHQLQQFRKEISILKSLSFDRNIVQFYGACVQGGKPMLVLEYMEGGDLRQAMSSARGEELRWYNKGQLIALDVARGLHFLHSNKVMHSDLKSKNILLTKDYSCAKIGDVGLARIMNSQYLSNAILGGTFAYAAPELLINARCSEKVDIYSFGVVAWEMATQETPQRGQLRGVKVPEECPVAIAQLIDDCLELDPANRPTARELFDRLRDAYEEGEGGLDHKVSVGSLSTVDTDAARELLNAAVSSKLRPHAITPEAGSSMGSSSWIHDPQGDSDLQSSSTLSADSRSGLLVPAQRMAQPAGAAGAAGSGTHRSSCAFYSSGSSGTHHIYPVEESPEAESSGNAAQMQRSASGNHLSFVQGRSFGRGAGRPGLPDSPFALVQSTAQSQQAAGTAGSASSARSGSWLSRLMSNPRR